MTKEAEVRFRRHAIKICSIVSGDTLISTKDLRRRELNGGLMPIFISYSHQDKKFVDRFAEQLVRNRVYVWLDRWELHVGDSITSRVEDAITNASALLVILSSASVESSWCKREINSGLMRELEERRVVVLPVLLEDCIIPLFLRDKIYADFRGNFDEGLRTVLEAAARISNPSTGRIDAPEFHSDWSLDWGESGGNTAFRVTIIQEAAEQKFTILSTISILADKKGDGNYKRLLAEAGVERANTEIVGLAVTALTKTHDVSMTLVDQFEQTTSYSCTVDSGNYQFIVSSRRLGLDNGRNVKVDIGSELLELAKQMRSVLQEPPRNRPPQ